MNNSTNTLLLIGGPPRSGTTFYSVTFFTDIDGFFVNTKDCMEPPEISGPMAEYIHGKKPITAVVDAIRKHFTLIEEKYNVKDSTIIIKFPELSYLINDLRPYLDFKFIATTRPSTDIYESMRRHEHTMVQATFGTFSLPIPYRTQWEAATSKEERVKIRLAANLETAAKCDFGYTINYAQNPTNDVAFINYLELTTQQIKQLDRSFTTNWKNLDNQYYKNSVASKLKYPHGIN